MWSIGFGLEKIGLAAMRRPVLHTLLLLLVSIAAASQISKVRFDGDVTAVLPENSEAYRNYFDNRERFRDFSRDITILVESPRLMTASGLEDLRFLQLEMAVTENVANATTLFSIPLPDRETGELGQFFPEEIQSDEEAAGLVRRLLETYPQAGQLIAPDSNAALIIVTLPDNLPKFEGYSSYIAIKEAALAAAPQDFTLRFTGLTPIGATIVSGLLTDQLRLTVIGILLGAAIALVVFRSFAAALICAVAPGLTALWMIGLFGWLGIPINYLTTVLPTLALIVSYADGIMLYFRWQQENAAGPDADANMVRTLVSVGPASSLTSITTLLAFLSFLFGPGRALHEFALLGAVAIALAYLAVIIGLPVAGHWASRSGLVKAGKVPEPRFGELGQRASAFVSPRPFAISAAAIAAVLVLMLVHFNVRPEYKITDFLPAQSEVRQAEAVTNEIFGGRSLLLFSVPKAEPGPLLSAANRQRLAEVEAVLAGVFDPARITSASRLAEGMSNEAALQRLAEQMEASGSEARTGSVSRDGGSMMITVRVPSDQSIVDTLKQIKAVEAGLKPLSYGESVVITGFDVLMAQEFTGLIEQLRLSLIVAIFLGVFIVAVAARSPLLAVAALTPNLLPILVVELAVWLRGGGINISEVIALTIAFGIAIDNAVHLINMFTQARGRGLSVEDATRAAMREAGPALGASTVIICVSSLVTQISVLPMVPAVGAMIIATLIVALISNLAILPANILALKRYFPENAGDPEPAMDKIEEKQL